MAKSEPFSLRLSPLMDTLVAEEARRTKRSKGAVLESLAEEALKMRLFPGIAFRGDDFDRRAWLMGTALDVWQVIDAYEGFGSAEAMAAGSDLSERQVALAVAYHRQFPDEVDALIERNRLPLADLRGRYPWIGVIEVEVD